MRLFNDGDDVIGIKDLVILIIDFDFGAAVFADEHAVALLDFKGDFFAIVVGFSGAEGDNETFGGFFLGGIRNDDAALFGFLLFDGFHEDPVAEGFYI